MKSPLNLNVPVEVKLTSAGMEVLRKHLEPYVPTSSLFKAMLDEYQEKYDKGQFFKLALWELAFLFGGSMAAGGESLFVNNDLWIELNLER